MDRSHDRGRAAGRRLRVVPEPVALRKAAAGILGIAAADGGRIVLADPDPDTDTGADAATHCRACDGVTDGQ